MLSLALFTSNPDTGYIVEQIAQEAGQFDLVIKGEPVPPSGELFQSLNRLDPEVILLDLADWHNPELVSNDRLDMAGIARYIQASDLRAVVIGFRRSWSRLEQADFEASGVLELLHEPFSALDLEKAAYNALHRTHPVTNQNILAFLPAKAGSGCSVATLNTAAALANKLQQKVLLLEADRRSGAFAIMLNLERQRGLPQALKNASSMSDLKWPEHYAEVHRMHVLLAEPGQRGMLAGWSDYYQLLRFVQEKYDFIFADLPEVVNEASAELVRCARGVFVICTPEVPSLHMALLRIAELKEFGVAKDRVHVLLNRQERGGLSRQDIENVLGRPLFATLPNDYSHVRDAIVQSRLVAPGSAFGEGCQELALKVSGLAAPSRLETTFGLLSKLRKRAS